MSNDELRQAVRETAEKVEQVVEEVKRLRAENERLVHSLQECVNELELLTKGYDKDVLDRARAALEGEG